MATEMADSTSVDDSIQPASLVSFDEDVLESDRNVLVTKFNEETARWISWMVSIRAARRA